jgi:ribosomal protein S18 acetylase RimI-like enzyme
VAVVVEDAFQHHGVGHRLMGRLREIALQNGITEFVAEVLPGNTAALHLLRAAGSTEAHFEGGEVEARVDLTKSPQPMHR